MKFFFLFLIFSSSVSAKVHLNEGIVLEYLKIQKEFSKTMCTPGTEDDFKKLTKSYLGDGRYIPITIAEKIDYDVIQNFVSLMNEKSLWLQNKIEFIKSTSDFKTANNQLELMESELEEYYRDQKLPHIVKIKSTIDELANSVPFLLSFKFPLDHLKLRSEYDHYKTGVTAESRRRANSIYFYRKIVQDGTLDEDGIKSDSGIRAAFDTLYLSLQEKTTNKTRLSDNDRVDLRFIIHNFSKLLKEGKNKQLARLQEWELRTNRGLLFYQNLLANKKVTNETILQERANALFNLKNYVLTNEARSYEFWSRQSELMQALFVMETILYNEVGRSDAPDALERRDVNQVIMNRYTDAKYNTFNPSDSLVPYLTSLDKKLGDSKWLNILFKEGEFSFTYFYIPANLEIYCPDMSRSGQFYRRENVRIALNMLNHPRKDFKAVRYYSRVSMFGRISMDTLWSDFKPLEEVPGKSIKNAKKIHGAFHSGAATLLYQFANEELKKTFQVVDIKNKNYVIDLDNTKNIYYYRSPQLFRYFAPIK